MQRDKSRKDARAVPAIVTIKGNTTYASRRTITGRSSVPTQDPDCRKTPPMIMPQAAVNACPARSPNPGQNGYRRWRRCDPELTNDHRRKRLPLVAAGSICAKSRSRPPCRSQFMEADGQLNRAYEDDTQRTVPTHRRSVLLWR